VFFLGSNSINLLLSEINQRTEISNLEIQCEESFADTLEDTCENSDHEKDGKSLENELIFLEHQHFYLKNFEFKSHSNKNQFLKGIFMSSIFIPPPNV
jgi:hypothetical protein